MVDEASTPPASSAAGPACARSSASPRAAARSNGHASVRRSRALWRSLRRRLGERRLIQKFLLNRARSYVFTHRAGTQRLWGGPGSPPDRAQPGRRGAPHGGACSLGRVGLGAAVSRPDAHRRRTPAHGSRRRCSSLHAAVEASATLEESRVPGARGPSAHRSRRRAPACGFAFQRATPPPTSRRWRVRSPRRSSASQLRRELRRAPAPNSVRRS